MCYSAQIKASYGKYVRQFGAHVSLHEFFDLFWLRRAGTSIQIPKALEAAFDNPATDTERQIKEAIDWFSAQQKIEFEAGLVRQRERLVKAQAKLALKVTKTSQEEVRKACDKITWAEGKLADLDRKQALTRDSRIFPGSYAPVMVWENGHRAEGHILPAAEHAAKVVVEFKPRPAEELLVACIWSRWTAPGLPDLLSFAVITDEPPPEVLAAGHDRCIVPIRPENIDAWLNPDPSNLAAQNAILDDRVRPFYEHRIVQA